MGKFFFLRGTRYELSCPLLRDVETSNPYLLGHFDGNGKVFSVYWGKNGLKVVPHSLDVFLHLTAHIVQSPAENGIFVDANTKGYSLVLVIRGRAELFIFRRSRADSNANEKLAILFADRIAKTTELPIYSDSLWAIESTKERVSSRVEKVKAHEGVFWNTVADSICTLASQPFTLTSEDALLLFDCEFFKTEKSN